MTIIAPLVCNADCKKCHGVCLKAGTKGYSVACVVKNKRGDNLDTCSICRLRFRCWTGELKFFEFRR